MIPVDPAIPNLELRIYAKDQPQYLQLPARVTEDGTAITCWKLSLKERLRILFRGHFHLTILTFNGPLQPISLSLEKPEVK